MPDPVVSIANLTHTYTVAGSSRTALSDVTCHADSGQILGFLGPNGSGKTTLFRILSTLMAPTSGSVTIAGHDLATQRDEIRRDIGVVFQSPSLDKQLTARENLRHHGHLYGLRGPELTSRMDELLSRVNLADRAGERVERFSGGMRRRVELAKGLLNRPAVLLLDEPSTGLDPGARIDLWNYLHEVQTTGVTILLTTHLMEEAERCDRLIILEAGRIVAQGTPDELRSSVGGDVISITTRQLAALAGIVREKLGLEAAQVGPLLRIERPRAHELVPQLIEAAPGMIDSVSVGRPTLEDVFIHVTGKRFDLAEAASA